ncbi:bile acid:sodium symporter family protein [Thermophilibacter immobilis]|uniref:Bile acid:sodium symporter family protein n=1 Tax=Thermophilibacter immobilis TaxID=2779519 RepID=A0A7S7M8H5_9ACTN|nr:bile acid:sodium symporter family protein [Thermophilibacter immobilis]QOY59783.1 bile acid:sodium symporter family protein [Thermophilibacter immobilis]
MDSWKRFGGLIGSHMAIIAPSCVVLGALFPSQLSILKPWVTLLFAFMTFQGALSNTFGNLLRTLRHPTQMLAALFVSAVVMPALAFLLASLFFSASPNLVCGIVLEYSVPVAVVSSMWIAMLGGDPSLGLATILVSTTLAPLTIPLTLHVLLGQEVEVDAARMMGEMTVSIALPALLGTTFNEVSRGRAAHELSPVMAPAAKLVLVLVILTNSTGVAPYMCALTPTLAAVTVFIGLFSTLGYALGLVAERLTHANHAQRVALTYLCGLRNISAGAVIAGEYFPGEVMFPVVIGTLFQQVVASLFGFALRCSKTKGRAEHEAPRVQPSARHSVR